MGVQFTGNEIWRIVSTDCACTVFDTFAVPDMTYFLGGASSTQTLTAVKDAVSKVAGNLDGFTFCGARQYLITAATPSNYGNVLSLNTITNVLTLGSTSTTLTDVGEYIITITVKLTNYPTITKTAQFTASVINCVVTMLTPTAVSNQ